MGQLFSGQGSIDIPPNEKFGRKKGKYGRMAGAIIQALGGLSSTPGLAREERKDPNATGVIYNRERGSKGAEAVNYSPRTKEKDEMERIMKEKKEKKGGRMFSDTTAFSINEGGLLGSKLVKPIGSEGNFIPPGISNRPINRKLLKRLGPDGGGMMIGGTSPIPGVSGHEYLNNPEYAEHRKDYYGKGKGEEEGQKEIV